MVLGGYLALIPRNGHCGGDSSEAPFFSAPPPARKLKFLGVNPYALAPKEPSEMAEEAEKPDSDDDVQEQPAESGESSSKTRSGAVRKILNPKVIATLVVLTVVINGVGLAFHSFGSGGNTIIGAEHDLGDYHFLAGPMEKGQIASAEFRLHIALLEDVELEAFHRLSNRKYRVQQDIEELLRQAHSGDFTDPTLGELKRRLQARINETLGMRAIADVIITDLKFTGGKPESNPPAETTESIPWADNSSA